MMLYFMTNVYLLPLILTALLCLDLINVVYLTALLSFEVNTTLYFMTNVYLLPLILTALLCLDKINVVYVTALLSFQVNTTLSL